MSEVASFNDVLTTIYNALIRCRHTIVFEKRTWLSEVWVAIVFVSLDVQKFCRHIHEMYV
jgi:hypothetical protein